MEETLRNPVRTVSRRDIRYLHDGSRMDEPATAYVRQNGHDVVRNNGTGDIVHMSNRFTFAVKHKLTQVETRSYQSVHLTCLGELYGNVSCRTPLPGSRLIFADFLSFVRRTCRHQDKEAV
ncbi:MAG: hypothetical protein HY731_05575 [Candidatus Tectomicrobia bacterium]|nr:hypothetical protein [Candidatus Tectomicrobia bacterium]